MRAALRYGGPLAAGLALVLIGWSGVLDRPGTAPPTAFGASTPLRPAVIRSAATSPTSTPSTSPPPIPSVPTRVQVPSLGVDAPIVPVAAAGQQLEPPADPAVVGWWSASPLVASTQGTTVLVGHVDSATDGPGALFPLGRGEARAGQQLVVSYAGGAARYRVVAQHVFAKSTGLPASVFAPTGPPQVVLVTCGGPFDHATKSYRDNVVVVAVPAT